MSCNPATSSLAPEPSIREIIENILVLISVNLEFGRGVIIVNSICIFSRGRRGVLTSELFHVYNIAPQKVKFWSLWVREDYVDFSRMRPNA
jgi:hypothetical protein